MKRGPEFSDLNQDEVAAAPATGDVDKCLNLERKIGARGISLMRSPSSHACQ